MNYYKNIGSTDDYKLQQQYPKQDRPDLNLVVCKFMDRNTAQSDFYKRNNSQAYIDQEKKKNVTNYNSGYFKKNN